MEENRIVVGQMHPRENSNWNAANKQNKHNLRPLRTPAIFAAVSLFTIIGGWITMSTPDAVQTVMSHVTAGFEYDDTLGRLQFVSNILPESAMVFLQHGTQQPLHTVTGELIAIHPWTSDEPWLEYACTGDIFACQDGEVITVVQNHEKDYTVRVLHENGYESIYSGLNAVQIHENDSVIAGQPIGTSAGKAAFEWREGGVSIQPVFGTSVE